MTTDDAREAVLRCINDGLLDDCLPEIGKAILDRTRGITGDPKVDLLAAITILDAELTELLTDPGAPKRRISRQGIEIHGQLEGIKRELDDMDRTDPTINAAAVEIEGALVKITRRLLHEVFKMKP